jgi:hypothetical protein
MTRKSVFRKLIFLPWTISVFLLCTGSLINFHQNRIWHKPLLPEFIAYKRDKEKTLDHASLQNIFHPSPLPFTILDADCNPVSDYTAQLEVVFFRLTATAPVPVSLNPGIHGLRAPPLS